MSLLNPRDFYKPFQYPKAYEYWEKQQNAHWLPSEVAMSKDINDWTHKLTESERLVVGQILKSFTQTEISVNEYWSRKVSKWFPKPEICMMASAFGAMESIHTVGYSYLNDSLGLDNYSAFLQDSTAVAKLDALKSVKGRSKQDIARSLAIFSGFTEGVNLFSSFAILMNFSRFNLLEGVETIVSWSVRDESLHSEAGCWLFRTLIEENPDIWTDELKKDIYDAARLSVKLEDDFIDNAFSHGKVRGLDPDDLKNFIRMRANAKLNDLGLTTNWKNIDQDSLKKMAWFDELSGGTKFTDFFSSRVTDYAKCGFTVDNLFEEEEKEDDARIG
jgi:ribonucleoside-diphosphate reductase beta chain